MKTTIIIVYRLVYTLDKGTGRIKRMKAIDLKSIYLTNPLGIGTTHPRFTWKVVGGKHQTSYEIQT